MPDPVDGGRDSSTPLDGSDECEGLTLCATAGTSCDGESVVTCAANADGCLVETRDDCAADGDVCSVTGGTASCIDPCLLIPTEMRCDAAGRSCDGDSLEICTANEDGCFVLEATDCAATPDGTCGMGDAMLQCLLPDPCAAVPAAERCTVEGTSCIDDDLVTCAPNSLGCLVTATIDCTTRAGGTCDDTTDPAAPICVATDACAGITQCAAAGAECDGPELVTCAPDAFGCLVETTEDCTATMFGFCDEEATPVDACSTAATDPCMGVTECGTAASRTCSTDGTTLTVCEANAFGCFVGVDTTCATGDVCDATGTMAMCVDACSLIDTCAAAGTSCDGADIVTCAADAMGCIVETTRTACAAGQICEAGAAPTCVADVICPEAGARFLDCESGTVNGNTAMGSDVGIGVGDCQSSGYEGNEQYWRFRHRGTGPVVVEITSTRGGTTGDYDLFALDGGDGTATCTTASLACLDESRAGGGNEAISFGADPGDLAYVVYDNWTDDTSTTAYTLTVTCIDVVCGDGTAEGTETCDDGNTTDGDGCSATCALDPGYECTGEPSVCTISCGDGNLDPGEGCDDGGLVDGNGCSATCTVETGYGCSGEPSVCVTSAPNAVCSGATVLGGSSGVAGASLAAGGPAPTATGCGASGGPVRYYAITVPARSGVEVVGDSTGVSWDLTLRALDSCGGACTDYVDEWSTLDEELSFENLTATPRTVYVAVGSFSATVFDTYDLYVTTTMFVCGNGTVDPGETCDDGDTTAGDGCSATCAPETGYICSGSPSVCVMPAANGFCAGATAITANTTITGVDTRAGGPRPTASGCGGGSGTNTHYYSVTIPAGVTVIAQTAPSLDIILFTLETCADTACATSTDSGPERATFTNTTGSAMTRIVGVRPYGSAQGTFDIAFTYQLCANGVVEGSETCDDGNTTAGDGCSATCLAEAGYSCVGSPSVCGMFSYTAAPIPAACVTTGTWTSLSRSVSDNDATTPISALPFAFTYFGGPVTHYSASDNGNVQLWSSSSGTPSNAWSNVAIPTASAPNGMLAAFWDDVYVGTAYALRAQTIGTAGSRVFVIEWNDGLAGSGGDPITFQAHLHEGTSAIEYHYCSIGGSARATGDSATIGIENLSGSAGVQSSHNTAGAVMTGSGFRYTPNP